MNVSIKIYYLHNSSIIIVIINVIVIITKCSYRWGCRIYLTLCGILCLVSLTLRLFTSFLSLKCDQCLILYDL